MMTDEEFDVLVNSIFENYKGQGDKLTDAMGSLVVAHRMGWRVLLLMTSESKFRRHEKLLGVNFKDLFEERGFYAHRSTGLKIIDDLNNFWNVVQGRQKMDRFDKVCIE